MSRRPGFNERSYICRNTSNHYTNFNLTVKLNYRVTAELLSHALKALINKHSWFTLNFYRNDSSDNDERMNGENFEVRRVDSIKFEDIVSFKSIESTFDGSVIEEVNKLTCPMNEPNLPLWRMIIFENRSNNLEQFICFYCDHALFDGISGLEFHKELLRELSNLSSAVNTDELKLLSLLFEKKENPALNVCDEAREEMLDIFNVPLHYRLMHYFKSFFFYKWVSSLLTLLKVKLFFFGNSLTLDFDPYHLNLLKHSMFKYKPISKDLSTKFRTLSFDTKEVEKMISFCKKSNLTLTPYLNIIALQCLQETLFVAIKDPDMEMFSTSSCIAVNGRRYYDLPCFLYGTLVGAEILNFGPMPSFSNGMITMTFMKAAYLRLNRSLRNKNSFISKGLQKKKNIWTFYSERIGKLEGKSTLVVSNLGVVKNEANSGWKFENIWFGLNTGSLYHFILNLVTTQEKGLNLVFCYAPEYDYLYDSSNQTLINEFLTMFRERVLLFPDLCTQ